MQRAVAIPIAGLRYIQGLLRALGLGRGRRWPLDPRMGKPWPLFDCQGEHVFAEEPFGGPHEGRAARPRSPWRQAAPKTRRVRSAAARAGGRSLAIDEYPAQSTVCG